jgi:hypothetical protein
VSFMPVDTIGGVIAAGKHEGSAARYAIPASG